jgi:Protein of unknown function (DUF3168)
MVASTLALQQAVYLTLTGTPALVAALGGTHIHDDVPQPPTFPYVSFGPSSVTDADTATERADLHTLTLHIWSRARGRKELHILIDLVRLALHDKPLALTGHRLINIRHTQTDTRRLSDGETLHSTLRFRALTEPV